MNFVIARDALLKPLNIVAGVVERRQTLPILANVLLVLKDGWLSLTGTDLEVEMVGRVQLPEATEAGEVTAPAQKLVSICQSLPEGCDISFSLGKEKMNIKSGRSKFNLTTMPAKDFPKIEDSMGTHKLSLPQAKLRRLLDRTKFAMAQQDVRYYLNGMLWEVTAKHIRMVATDGHRLAMCTLEDSFEMKETKQVILPRKGVLELHRLLGDEEGAVDLVIGDNNIRAATPEFSFTSKLVDGKFPEYAKVLPKDATKNVVGDREELRRAFARAAILSNEKYRGVRLHLSQGNLKITANNPEQDDAEEALSVDYAGEELDIGFNVGYLLDVLNAVEEEKVRISLTDTNSSALLQEAANDDSVYVVMPMRL